MKFPILEQYAAKFPASAASIEQFEVNFEKKLWNELTLGILHFLYDKSVKGKVGFDFYTEFVKKFQKNIDQIKLLKIIKETIFSLKNEQILAFLQEFEEKQAFTEETKSIVNSLQGFVYARHDFSKCSDLLKKVSHVIETRKDVDSSVYATFYRFAMEFYTIKNKHKQYYTNALQFLAYVSAEEIQDNEKTTILFKMAIAVLVSTEIYNFSELLEQPLLVSLQASEHAWLYRMLEIFNKGDIEAYEKATLEHPELKENKQILKEKIRLMAFLEIAFNLPKSDRVVNFKEVVIKCGIPHNQVEFLVMKAMALNLVKGSIDQLGSEITITWVAPKVLEVSRVSVMLTKFNEWGDGVKKAHGLVTEAFAK